MSKNTAQAVTEPCNPGKLSRVTEDMVPHARGLVSARSYMWQKTKSPSSHGLAAKYLEATSGFEPLNKGFADPRLNPLATSPCGAGDEIRTRDPLLGKEMLYR